MARKTKTVAVVKPTTKKVHNRNNYKMEVVSNGVVYVFPPKTMVTVPDSVSIPIGRGLIVKK